MAERIWRTTALKPEDEGKPGKLPPDDFAAFVMQYKPPKPDVIHDGVPYFFFGTNPANPKAGYHVHFDATPDQKTGTFTFDGTISDLGVELAIRGGLGTMIAEGIGLAPPETHTLTDVWHNVQTHALMAAAEYIPESQIPGVWVDSSAGNGTSVRTFAKTIGIRTLVQVNAEPLHHLIAQVATDQEPPTTTHIIYVNERVQSVAPTLVRQNLTPISGIVCMHPNDEMQINGTFALPQQTNSPNTVILIRHDNDQTPAVDMAATTYGFHEDSKKTGPVRIFLKKK